MPPDFKALLALLLICGVELSAFQMDPRTTGPELLTMPELKALARPGPRQKLWPNLTNFSTLPSSATNPLRPKRRDPGRGSALLSGT